MHAEPKKSNMLDEDKDRARHGMTPEGGDWLTDKERLLKLSQIPQIPLLVSSSLAGYPKPVLVEVPIWDFASQPPNYKEGCRVRLEGLSSD